jgi:hypothetical protein
MFPQLGAPPGLFFSTSVFLILSRVLTDDQVVQRGRRLPVLCTALRAMVRLYVRLAITATPGFSVAMTNSSATATVTVWEKRSQALRIA